MQSMFMKTLFVILCCLSVSCNAYAAEPRPWQMLFQSPASPLMEELNSFHDFLLIITGSIVCFVFGLLTYTCVRFRAKANPVPEKFSHNITIEIIWTIIPVIILIIIAIPSFRILRIAEIIPPADMTVKVVGYQWYWHYTYPDHGDIEFDSYMIPDDQIVPPQRRLLEVDNRVVIPENTNIKFLITAGDVIHSFAVPSFGIKTDAVPGRTNETWVRVNGPGVYYGQCSELCGVNHGFMPIAIEVVTKEDFDKWVEDAKKKFAKNPFTAIAYKTN